MRLPPTALGVLTCATYAHANGCYWTKVVIENNVKTVHKGFRDPLRRRGCRWNHDSGLRPPEAYALEVAILERLNAPRNVSGCTGRWRTAWLHGVLQRRAAGLGVPARAWHSVTEFYVS